MPPSATIEARDKTVKEAQRYLRDKVRNDWTFESSTFQSHPPPVADPTIVSEWRPWDYDSSAESESEELQRVAGTASVTVQDISVQNHGAAEQARETVESEKDMTPEERKAKRRRSMEEEMTWNDGLRIWSARREAWAGARKLCDVQPDAENKDKDKEETQSNDAQKTVLPVAPALLPEDNPIRASITPALYPSIYSKVVVQGLTPTIPINLADMTKCLVQGWQADGQWPARPVPLFPDGRGRNDAAAAAGAGSSHHVNNNINRATGSQYRRDTHRPSTIATNANATTTTKPTISTSVKSPSSPSAATPTSPISPNTAGSEAAPSSPESKRRSTVASAVKKVFHFPSIHRRNASSIDHSDHHGEERQSTIPTFEDS